MMDPAFQLAFWSTLVYQEALERINIQLSPFEPIGQSHVDYRSNHARPQLPA
jgi:hypothetical protein